MLNSLMRDFFVHFSYDLLNDIYQIALNKIYFEFFEHIL